MLANKQSNFRTAQNNAVTAKFCGGAVDNFLIDFARIITDYAATKLVINNVMDFS